MADLELNRNTYQTLFNNASPSIPSIVKEISTNYSKITPHVNGFYYIGMVHGSWLKDYSKMLNNDTLQTLKKIELPVRIENGNFGQCSSYNKGDDIQIIRTGTLATDIDIPQLNTEYDTITGKTHNINYASKLNYTGDFSINYIDTSDLNSFRYHLAWTHYIELLKKGYIKSESAQAADNSYFIDIPYFNSVYILIFEPFSSFIKGVIKIMGVSPINNPIKQIIGDRSKSNLTTINQNYKSNDIFWEFYDKPRNIYDNKANISTDIILNEAIQDLKLKS